MIRAMSKKKDRCCPDNVITTDHIFTVVYAAIALALVIGLGCGIHTSGYESGVREGVKLQRKCDSLYYSFTLGRCSAVDL